MPYESLVPATFPTWDIDVVWPQRTFVNPAVGAASALGDRDQGQRFQIPQGANNATAYMVDILGNSTVPDFAFHRGLYCITPMPQPTIRPSVFFFCDSALIAGPLDSQAFAPGDGFPSAVSVIPYQRVYIDDLMVAFGSDPTPLGVNNSIARNIPDTSAVQSAVHGNVGTHYGLRADGAGGVEFASIIGGVIQETVALTWPAADMRDWVKVTVEHIMASPTGPAQVRYLFNDVPVLTRAWGAGTVLPDFVNVANSRHIRRYFGQRLGEPQGELYFSCFRSRIGRFTVDGVELS